MADENTVPRSDSDQDPEKQEAKGSVADRLVEIAHCECTFFRDPMDDAFVRVPIGGRSETMKVESHGFRAWLSREYYVRTKRVPSGQAKSDALGVLVGFALHGGEQEPVHLRVAGHEGAIYIDLADEARNIVEVQASGWRVIKDAPIKFLRPKAMLPLPLPVRGGNVAELRSYINMRDDGQFCLLVAWAIAALRPTGPYPILTLTSEQGSGKSFATRMVCGLVDPNASLLRTMPKEEGDLAVSTQRRHVLSFDNLSGLSPAVSDALCRLATGGGLSKRALYTNDDEVILDAKRPVILNGIDDIATRADLADRCLVLSLPVIAKSKRKREKELMAGFEAARPRLFGALLDGLVSALRNEGTTKLIDLPRMADFAVWATAAEQGLGWPPGTFMTAYDANRRDMTQVAIDADPIARAVLALMDDKGAWQGNATALVVALHNRVSEDARNARDWPKKPQLMANAIRRAAPLLRAVGVNVDYVRTESERTIRIVRADESPPRASSLSSSPSSLRPVNDAPDDPDGLRGAHGADILPHAVGAGDALARA